MKKKTLNLLIILAIILLVVVIILGRDAEKAEFPQLKKSAVATPTVTAPIELDTEEIGEELEFEEEKEISKPLTIEDIRQKQLEGLREDIETKGANSEEGKYPTLEELEEIEKSGAVLY